MSLIIRIVTFALSGLLFGYTADVEAVGWDSIDSEQHVFQTLDAEDAAIWDYWLYFSWSSTVRQDTLLVSENIWTHCYLWGNFPVLYNDFMGFTGNLMQTEGIQVHGWRFLLTGQEVEIELDPEATQQIVSYDEFECYNVIGEKALFEFDVYIDASLVDLPGGSTTAIGLLPPGVGPVAPEAYFRVSPDEECGLFSIAIQTDSRLISVHSDVVPNEQSSFGSIKAMYR